MTLRFLKLVSVLSVLLVLNACNREIRKYINSNSFPIKVYIEPTIVDIDIYFLRSISSLEASDENKKELIKKVSKEHSEWFNTRLKNSLSTNGMEIVPKDNADLVLESRILDMGEVRTRKFVEGLSVGLVLGAIIGEATGDPQVGLAVFAWEVVEEIIIVYLLKTFLMITTIGLVIKKKDGTVLSDTEFTSYSNRAYEKTIPESLRSLRETRVQGSLDQNIQDIVKFLEKEK